MNLTEFLESINQEQKQCEERLEQDILRAKFSNLLKEIIDFILDKSYYHLKKKLISQVPLKDYLKTQRYYLSSIYRYEHGIYGKDFIWDKNKYYSAINTLEDNIFNLSKCDYLIDEYIKIIVKYKNI